MPTWIRIVLAVLGGLAAWLVAATSGNLIVRLLLSGYAAVEHTMEFTLPMLVARLVVGALASLAAGAAAVAIARGARVAIYLVAILLLLLFVPVHVSLWARFPVWYHVTFLGSLVPLVVVGASLLARRNGRAA